MNILVRYRPQGRSAKEISASVEAGVRSGQLSGGDQLPPVRELAGQLGVSPTTVAAAYGELRRRGITTGTGRAGTRIVEPGEITVAVGGASDNLPLTCSFTLCGPSRAVRADRILDTPVTVHDLPD